MKSKIYFPIAILMIAIGSKPLIALSQRRLAFGQPVIGAQVPNLAINDIVAFDKSKTTIHDLAGKLVILDFGGIYCSPCVAGLPHLDSMQQKFNGKIQIFWVTTNSKDELQKFLRLNPIGKRIHAIPMVANDTILQHYFKPSYVPHEVWINEDGMIKAVTDPEYIDEHNIELALSNATLDWPVKRYIQYDINADLVIFNYKAYGQIATPQTIFHSVLTSHIGNEWEPGMNTTIDSLNKTETIHMKDYKIFDLYKIRLSASDPELKANSHFLIKVKNLSRLFYNRAVSGYEANWKGKNTYCYEISYPIKSAPAIINKKIITDLNLYLGLNGRIIDTIVNCWVIKSAGKQVKNSKTDYNGNTLKVVAEELNNRLGVPPVFTEANTQNIVFNQSEFDTAILQNKFSYSPLSIQEQIAAKMLLTKFFQSKGLKLIPEKRKQRMFVLEDAN